MDAKLTWKDGVAFDGVADSGNVIRMDTKIESGGTNTGPSPMELILMALGGCTGMDVISILQKKRQDVTKFEIVLHGDRAADHPKVYTAITVEFIVTGHAVDLEAVERAIELSETKYCSASAMLRKSADIKTKITIKEG